MNKRPKFISLGAKIASEIISQYFQFEIIDHRIKITVSVSTSFVIRIITICICDQISLNITNDLIVNTLNSVVSERNAFVSKKFNNSECTEFMIIAFSTTQ